MIILEGVKDKVVRSRSVKVHDDEITSLRMIKNSDMTERIAMNAVGLFPTASEERGNGSGERPH